jgi:ATP-dependent 26S proteasome regulatory subunit
VGLLQDEVDPMVSVMKVEKAPLESYADVGGLEQQIQEIKVKLTSYISKSAKQFRLFNSRLLFGSFIH